MITIECDNCEKPFEVENDQAGAKVPCPECGDVNRVPEGRTPVAAAAAPPADSSGAEHEIDVVDASRPVAVGGDLAVSQCDASRGLSDRIAAGGAHGDAEIAGGSHHAAQGLEPLAMPPDSREPAALGPAPVAIHDDGHVARHTVGSMWTLLHQTWRISSSFCPFN